MYPASFEYFAPTTLEEAGEILERYGDEAKVLAGGQSLIPLMKLRFASPKALVDVNGIDGLDTLAEDGGGLKIGALVRHSACEGSELLKGRFGALGDAAPQISDPIVRNRGTVGGSLAHADPQGDWGSVMIAVGAEVVARGPGGERTIPVRELFDGPFTTKLEPSEILTEIRVPGPGREGGRHLPQARAQGRRLRHGRRRRPRLVLERLGRARGDRADRSRPDEPRRHRGRGGARRQGARRRGDRRGSAPRGRGGPAAHATCAAARSTSETSSASSRSEVSALRPKGGSE